jgi:sterol desaturase/sphingolipid hydroxylase (fatty acid hydroxylase superfamily)
MKLDLTVYAIPAFIVLMLVEAIVISGGRWRGYESKDTAASLAMGVGNVLIDLVMKGVAFAFFAFVHRFSLLSLDPASLPVWLAALVATDFVYYWFHRLHHEIRFFWAAHVNHHSSEHYNLSTALRQSWTTPFTSIAFYWPLALIGFDPGVVLACIAINTLYQFWIHTEAIDRVGAAEWLINTPSHHRVHHGANVEYLDRNYGGMLILWDRLFRTFEPEREPVRYGLTKNIHTFNPVKIAFHEWVAMIRDALRAPTLGVALRYVVEPPGWSPDGSTLTAPEMRAAWLAGGTAAIDAATTASGSAA